MKRPQKITVIGIATIVLLSSAVSFAVSPTDGGMAGRTKLMMNTGAGNQIHPRVSGDLVTYTDTSTGTIHYYSFVTNVDREVPKVMGSVDTLADVFGTRIAFSRLSSDRRSAMVFDTTTSSLIEIAPQVGSVRTRVALGGVTLAIADFSVGNGDVMAYDLSTSGSLVNLSADENLDTDPAVTPSGDAVVWRRCNSPSTGTTECAIMKSMRSGGIWSAATVFSDVPGALDEEPDTDGTYVVYASDRSSNTGIDIYYRLLSGAGTESHLEMAGSQFDPKISAGVIAFESYPDYLGSNSDIYVYKVPTNILVQVTDTPNVSEELSDISVLANGDVRVVWEANDGSIGNHNLYAQTFTPPAPPNLQVPSHQRSSPPPTVPPPSIRQRPAG